MTWLDWCLIALVAASTLLGVWRGLAHEALALLGWVLAYLLAREFAPSTEHWFQISNEVAIRTAAAFGVIFLGVLIVTTLLAKLLSGLVNLAGLGILNRVLGGFFGLARAALLLMALVWAAGFSGMHQQAFWEEAKLTGPLEATALSLSSLLPEKMSSNLNY